VDRILVVEADGVSMAKKGTANRRIASLSAIVDHGTMRVRVSLAIVAMLAAACGSGGSSATPSEQCTDVGTTVCTHDAECAVVAGVITQSQSGDFVTNCETGFQTSAACSQATQVSGDPDTCMSDFRAEPCSAFDATTGLPVPSSCVALFR
jgi:hypothetical protein